MVFVYFKSFEIIVCANGLYTIFKARRRKKTNQNKFYVELDHGTLGIECDYC